MCVCPTPFLYFSFPPECVCVCVCVRVEPWPRERKKRLLCLCVCEGLKLLTQREYNDHCHIYNKSLCCLCWPLPWQNGGQSGGLCCYMLCFEWNWITLGNWIWCAHDPLFIDGRVVEREGDCRQCYYLVIWVSLRLCVCVCRNKLPLFLHPDKKRKKKKNCLIVIYFCRKGLQMRFRFAKDGRVRADG